MNKKIWIFSHLILFFASCKKDYFYYTPIDMYSANTKYDDSNAPIHLNVAAVSTTASKYDKAETLNTIKSMVEKIKAEHSDIQVIVFDELALYWSQPLTIKTNMLAVKLNNLNH